MYRIVRFYRFVNRLLPTERFFRIILGLFVLQAAWIALSARYPMAFDEDFHLGIIKLYAHHPYPFWHNQPPGGNAYGAIARDPSYLYHYLMSFPYNAVSFFTSNQAIQILFLRAINIGLFTSALIIFRRVLLASGASRQIVHSCLLMFIFIPIVPLVAAQINYDSLLIPVTGACVLLTIRIDEALREHKRLCSDRLIGLLSLCLLASLVKYAFLPIFAALISYVFFRAWRTYGSGRKAVVSFLFGLTLIERRIRWLLLVLFIVATGLFSERYVINIAHYHTPVPDCGKVLTVKQCSAYGPWIRDYTFANNKPHITGEGLNFPSEWLYGMWLRLFFTVGGPATGYETRAPFIVPALSAIIFTALGAVLTVIYGRRVWRRYRASVLGLYIWTSAAYIIALMIDEFAVFIRTDQPVAINGRYLLPVLLLLMLWGALAFNELLRQRLPVKNAVLTIAIASLLWGGGALTFILRSSDRWYWPSPPVRVANRIVQVTLGPLTPGYRFTAEFLR